MSHRDDLDAWYERSGRFWALWKRAYEQTTTPEARAALSEALGLAALAFKALEDRAEFEAAQRGRVH